MEKIRASELRINNIVEADGIIQRVYRIWQNGAELVEQEDGDDDLDYHENDIHPIPLTEEWYNQMPEWFFKMISGGYMNMSAIPNGYIDVKFVHTAQNLFFVLAGKELSLSLP